MPKSGWTVTTNNGYVTATETLTFQDEPTAGLGSEIDFIPTGSDFSIISNCAGTNLSTSGHVELQIAYISGGTYVLRKDFGVDIDNAKKVDFVDVSKIGAFPYYKLYVEMAGVQKEADTVQLLVIVDPTQVSRVQDCTA